MATTKTGEADRADDRQKIAGQPATDNAADHHDDDAAQRRGHGQPTQAMNPLAENEIGEDRRAKRDHAGDEQRVGDGGVELGPDEQDHTAGHAHGGQYAAPAYFGEGADHAFAVAERDDQEHGQAEQARAVEQDLPAAGLLHEAQHQT